MKTTLSFLHLADLHIGARFAFLPPELAQLRRQHIKDAFAESVRIAIGKRSESERVEVFLISGDLFDSANPSLVDIAFVQQQLRILQRNNVSTFLISGNHDWYEKGNFWDNEDFPVTRHFTSYDFDIYEDPQLDLTVVGIAFNRKRTSVNHLAQFDYEPQTSRSILLYHGAWQNPSITFTRDYPFKLEDVEKLRINYVALGHYHKMTKLVDEKKTKVCYSGSIEGLDFAVGELGKRFIIRGEIASNGDVAVVPIEMNKMEMECMDYDCTTFSLNHFLNELHKSVSPHRLLKVTLTGVPTVDFLMQMPKIKEELEGQFAYLNFRDETLQLPKDLPEDEQTYLGLFARRIRSSIDQATDPEEKRLLRKALEYGLAATCKSE
ncbi:MAG: DNA repair exonuclease [bacterium]